MLRTALRLAALLIAVAAAPFAAAQAWPTKPIKVVVGEWALRPPREPVAGRREAERVAVQIEPNPRRDRPRRAVRQVCDAGFDILQATLLKSFEHFAEFQGSGKPALMAWLRP